MAISIRRVSALLLTAALVASAAVSPVLAQGGAIGGASGGVTRNSSEGAPAGGTGNLTTTRTSPTGGEGVAPAVSAPRVRQPAPRRTRHAVRRTRPAVAPASAAHNSNFNADDRVGTAGTSTGSHAGPRTGATGSATAR